MQVERGNVQEQQTQTMVLQQPKDQKVYLDVQHSTDTTAIWSFIIAMVVAFILGVSATIIAIWYGRKSFKLTEMSFKTVVEQIKASEQSALDLNTKLFNQQLILQDREQKALLQTQWIENFRPLAQSYISKILEILFILDRFEEKYLHLSKTIKLDEKTDAGKYLDQISLLIEQAVVLTSHIELFLESYALKDNRIIYFSDFFNKQAVLLKQEYINVNHKGYLEKIKQQGVKRDTDEMSKEIYADSDEYIQLLENENRLGVLLIYSRMINDEFKKLLNKKAA